jgi:hypothetical protein
MSVVLVTNRRASARWQGYHGIELAPARLVGIMPGARPLRLVAVVALLCAAVVVAVGLGRPAGEGGHARGTVGACLRPSRRPQRGRAARLWLEGRAPGWRPLVVLSAPRGPVLP